MIPLNYHHLYYFWTVAKCGSIAAAKDKLYLSQPTLSSQLQQLERSCKMKLLERGRKGVELTAEGRSVLGYCERMFSAGEELAAVLEKGPVGPAVLRLGVQTTIPRDAVVRVLDFARKQAAPQDLSRGGAARSSLREGGQGGKVRVAILNGELHGLSARLRRHALDLVISSEDFVVQLGRDFRSRLVSSLPVSFVASPAVMKSVRRFPADLSGIPLLLRPPENPVRKQVDQYLAKHRVSATVEAEVDDVDLIRCLAIEGRGIAALSALLTDSDVRGGRLARLNRQELGLREQIWIVGGKHPKSNSSLRGLIGALMESFTIRI